MSRYRGSPFNGYRNTSPKKKRLKLRKPKIYRVGDNYIVGESVMDLMIRLDPQVRYEEVK